MVKCAKCRRRIGFFEKKYDYKDDDSKPVKYCKECDQKWLQEEEKKKLKKKNEKEKLRLKEKTQKEKHEQKARKARIEEDNKRKAFIKDYLIKYLTKKDWLSNGNIGGLNNKNCMKFFNKDKYSLVNIRDFYESDLEYYRSLNNNSLSADQIDEVMNNTEINEKQLEFFDDLEKIYKILKRKEIKTDYLELISLSSEIIMDNLNKEIDKGWKPFVIRISNKIGKNITKESVIKELLKIEYTYGMETSSYIVSKVLDKFNIKYDSEELDELIEKIQKEIELEDFEENLGSSNKKVLEDFSGLSGYKFEEYLKNLFKQLGYRVLKTNLSGDQGADLIIADDGEKVVVQTKKYEGNVSNKAIQEIVASKNYYRADRCMVVTNSSFTKSAIDLALSNKVELWDGKKLKRIIKEANKNKKSYDLCSESESTINENSKFMPMSCPFCKSNFNLEIEKLPKRGEPLEMNCLHCKMEMRILHDSSYDCKFCGESFDTIKELFNHHHSCKKVKEITHACPYCKKDFFIDKSENAKLNNKNKITVNCPHCNKKIIIKK